ncbi:hypothetical protein HYC85_025937 [Camellia sinensis]|uniref:Vacuolar protein 8 n=1 Tax=Camellia sinensis TaxID=4442 RepID=A0A7J7G5C5_CAMSI|nr:hypothetical protein HYC85_025937 [Camellia sinensis]
MARDLFESFSVFGFGIRVDVQVAHREEKIVEEGGLDALLMPLQSSQNTTILRVASGAIANLAMNEANQSLIMNKGGARLLANTTSKTDDPQSLRMVAGAIANLCGNGKLKVILQLT